MPKAVETARHNVNIPSITAEAFHRKYWLSGDFCLCQDVVSVDKPLTAEDANVFFVSLTQPVFPTRKSPA